MEEIWKDIDGFPGYQVSSEGRVRSFWKKKHVKKGYGTYRELSDEPYIMAMSDDGNGYLKLMLYDRKGNRKCKKVHRLVAEAFIPQETGKDTVDHIISGPKGKLNNSVSNLRWLSRRENIQKAYNDGINNVRNQKVRKPISVYDLWEDKEMYFDSIVEASERLRIPHRTIAYSVDRYTPCRGRYQIESAGREEKLLYGDSEEYQCFSWL